MDIAIIGWGSLIWFPGALQIKSCWHRDGPTLPIEFARVSKDGRLTLVIHPGSTHQQSLWAMAVSPDIHIVRQNLLEREGITDSRLIHSVTAAGEVCENVGNEVRDAIASWLKTKSNLQGCVWTGLSSNWKAKQKSEFSVPLAIQYLRNLQDPARAREYVQNTPDQIQTAVRKAAREELGWDDATLSPSLFPAD